MWGPGPRKEREGAGGLSRSGLLPPIHSFASFSCRCMDPSSSAPAPFTTVENPPLDSTATLQDCGEGSCPAPNTHSVLGKKTPEFSWAHSSPGKDRVPLTALQRGVATGLSPGQVMRREEARGVTSRNVLHPLGCLRRSGTWMSPGPRDTRSGPLRCALYFQEGTPGLVCTRRSLCYPVLT